MSDQIGLTVEPCNSAQNGIGVRNCSHTDTAERIHPLGIYVCCHVHCHCMITCNWMNFGRAMHGLKVLLQKDTVMMI